MNASRNILSHWFIIVSVSGEIVSKTFLLPLMPIAVRSFPSGASKVWRKTMCRKRATDPRFGRKVRLPPFTIAKLLPFGSVGLQFQL